MHVDGRVRFATSVCTILPGWMRSRVLRAVTASQGGEPQRVKRSLSEAVAALCWREVYVQD